MTKTTRNFYGEIVSGDELVSAKSLLKLAAGKLPRVFDNTGWGSSSATRNKRVGARRMHEIYDVNLSGTRALVCVRETESTKYGTATTSKEYFVVAKHGTGTRILPAKKSVAAKAAKLENSQPGDAIDIALGKRALKPRLN